MEQAELLVAHNYEFDRIVIESEYLRLGIAHPLAGKRVFCTMRAATDIMKLPGPHGLKWPTLQEAHRYFVGGEFARPHDALADAQACLAVYQKVVARCNA